MTPPSGARKAVARRPMTSASRPAPSVASSWAATASDLERGGHASQLPVADERLADRHLGDVVDRCCRVGDELLGDEAAAARSRADRPARAG